MKRRPIYLDYQATTPLDPRVLEVMMPYLTEKFGNPHSTSHQYGWEAEAGVELGRQQIAALIGVQSDEIIFTSGATEANNLAIKGIAYSLYPQKSHIITQATEHKCVLDSVKSLERSGFRVTVLPVDRDGRINIDTFAAAITPDTGLVSIMAVNNEIGTIQPLAEIGALCAQKGIYFHCDAAQAVGRIPLDISGMNIAAMSLSAHKIYGPKGIGALYVRRSGSPVPIMPLFDGGGQERGIRSGTLSPALCAGMGAACEIMAQEGQAESQRIAVLGQTFWQGLQRSVQGVRLNGSDTDRYWGNINLSFTGDKADKLLSKLKNIAISSGAACASGSTDASYVLKAIGLDKHLAEASLRIGIGRQTTPAELEIARDDIIQAVSSVG